MDNVSSSSDKIAPRGTIALRYFLVVLATVVLIGCSGAPVTQPQGPSGVITVTPASSSAAPFTIPVDSSQIFSVSEAGYSGAFSFAGSQTNKGVGKSTTVGFNAPAGVSVRLEKTTGGCVLGHCFFVYGSSYTVLVTDSVGNSITIYTN